MNLLLFLSLVISFSLSFFSVPFWIKKAKMSGLVWEDMNKMSREKNIAGSGGIVVVLAFSIAVLSYIATRTFFFKDMNISPEIFSLLSVILIITIMGIVDDLF